MSRYLILLLLNLPFILASIMVSFVDYKLGNISRRKHFIQTIIWLLILAGLISAKYIYVYLFSNHLTQTEPLSLFDVIQITGIVTVLYFANRSRIKIEALDRRVQDLHQELSIRLSVD
ncbi:hypothetical protein KDA08_04775, partial [Candidatus Saccharibacteria bacterium]|nr:hypothetical protein [Candidatus Saccharibacteria bacterium]